MTDLSSTSRAFRGDEADLQDWWASVAQLHCEEAAHVDAPEAGAAALMEAARIYVEHIDDVGRGIGGSTGSASAAGLRNQRASSIAAVAKSPSCPAASRASACCAKASVGDSAA